MEKTKKGKKKLELELSKENCDIVEKTITDGILQCYGNKIPRDFILCNHTIKRVFFSEGEPHTTIPEVRKITCLQLIPDFGDAVDLEEEEKCCQMLIKNGFEKDIEYLKDYACKYRQHLKEIVHDRASMEGIPKKKDLAAYKELKKEWTNPGFIPLNHIAKEEKRIPKSTNWTRGRKIVSLATPLPPMTDNNLVRTGLIETLASYLATFINKNVRRGRTEIYFSYSMIPEGGERVKLILFISYSTDGDDISEDEPVHNPPPVLTHDDIERISITPEIYDKLQETIKQYKEEGKEIDQYKILKDMIAKEQKL